MNPASNDAKKTILTLTDNFSKFSISTAARNMKASMVAQVMKKELFYIEIWTTVETPFGPRSQL